MRKINVDVLSNGHSCPLNKFQNENELVLIETEDVKIPDGLKLSDYGIEEQKHLLIGMFKMTIGNKTILRAFPVDENGKQDKRVWYMFGGRYIAASDSRYPFDYPVRLMERVEN